MCFVCLQRSDQWQRTKEGDVSVLKDVLAQLQENRKA